MKHPFRNAVLLAAAGAVPLVITVIVLPGDRPHALDVYVLYLGAVLLFVLARVTSGAGGRRKPIPPAASAPSHGRLRQSAISSTGTSSRHGSA